MNITDTHVSANNPFISHQGPRDVCQFPDCIARRVRYEVLAPSAQSPGADVVRLLEWKATATAEELRIARLEVRDDPRHWAALALQERS
jgi:hypothetical protein